MAKISAYPDGGSPQNGDLFVIARGGSNVRMLYNAIVSALTSIFNVLYASAANGVTNGNSHGHIVGDGAAITEDAITLADVTTNNSSTTKHGFLKKLDNTATNFMDGQGNWDSVKDSDLSTSDITTNNASTSKHGFLVKATAPAAGLINYVGIGNGETVYTNKALFDTTNPAAIGTASPGTQVIAARRDHVHAQASFIVLGDESTLTISGGIITVTTSFHLVDTEGGAATDDLDTINGGSTGALLVLSTVASARDVTVKDATGNIRLAGDFTLNTFQDTITLMKFADGFWYELSRSDNA